MNKSVLQAILLSISLLTLCACNKAVPVASSTPLSVNAIVLKQPHASQQRELIGQVVAAEVTPLSFRIPGEIVQLKVKAGDKVNKGQLLASLDTEKLSQLQAEARYTFELAQRQLKRAKPLYNNDQLSDIAFRELQANLKLARVNYQLASDRLSYSQLVAPFNGMVSSVPKEAFESVQQGETVLTLYQQDQLYINVPLSFDLLAQLNPGQNRRDYQPIAAFPNTATTYAVSLVEYSVEPVSTSRALEAWFKMPQPVSPILPGTSVTLTMDSEALGIRLTQGYLLPYNALQAGDVEKQFYVWKLINGRAQRFAVTTSTLTSNGVLVNQGVSQQDVILTSGLDKLRDGMTVIAKTQEK